MEQGKRADNLKYIGIITSISRNNNQVILSDFPKEIKSLPSNIEIEIGFSPNFTTKFLAEAFIFTNKCIKIQLKDILSESKLRPLIRQAVYIEDSFIKKSNPKIILPEEFLNLEVINISTNEAIGVITDVNETNANQILIVENDEFSLPIPNIKEVVKNIDFKNKKIYIEVIEGLLDLKEKKRKK